MGSKIRHYPFRQSVAALKGVRLTTLMDKSSYIRSVFIHWPDGCNALVDVQVGYDRTQLVPSEAGEYLALNDSSIFFPPPPLVFAEEVVGSARLWVEIRNGDSANSHTISAIIVVEEK